MTKIVKPLPFQWWGIRRISFFKGRALLADEMGLGKTIQSLMWAKRHNEFPVLVICPATLKINWQREALDKIGVTATILYGRKPPKDKAALKSILSSQILIINYDIVYFWRILLKKFPCRLLIIDEADAIKNRGLRRNKSIIAMGKRIKNVIVISGTPLTNRPEELYASLRIIRPDVFRSFLEYGQRYCGPKIERGRWVYKGASNLKELHQRLLKLCMIRRKKDQVLKDLPQKQRTVILLDMPNQGRKEYDKARNDLMGWWAAFNTAKAKRSAKMKALSQINTLRQIAIKHKLDSITEWIDNFFNECDRKLVVFCYHRNVANYLHKRYSNSVLVNGSITGKKRQAAVDGFQNNPKIKLLVGNLKAAGKGLTLTASSDTLIVELDYNPSILSQAEDRTHRISQVRNCSVWYLIMRDTIEETMLKSLHIKQSYIETILDGNAGNPKALDLLDLLKKEINNAKKTK